MKDEHDITLLSTQPDHIGEVTEMVVDTISRQDAIALLEETESAWLRGDILLFYPVMLKGLKKLPSAESELENKIRAIGYTGKEGRIYIGGRLFAVRELPQ